MTCKHISQSRQEIKNFIQEMGNHASSLYEKLGPVVNEEDIKIKKKGVNKGLFSGSSIKLVPVYNAYDFFYLSEKVIVDFGEKIENLLNECTCYEDLEREKSWQNEEIKTELEKNKEQAEINNKNLIEKIESLEYRLQEEKKNTARLLVEKGGAEKENQLLKIESERAGGLQTTLLGQLQNIIGEKLNLQNTVIDQDREIVEAGTENSLYKKRLSFIYKNKLVGELREANKDLEGINRRLDSDDKENIVELRRAYEELFRTEKHNKKKIYETEDKIEKIKSEINLREDIQEVYRICERVAKLRVQLEQLEQKYEAEEEIPLSF
jgi:hypothetical protein